MQFSSDHSDMFDSSLPHGLQHTRLPYPSPTPRAYSNSSPSSQSFMPSNHLVFCHPLQFWPSVFPSIRVYSKESVLHIRWPSIGVSASVLSVNIQDWIPLGLTGWISLQSKGLWRVFSNTTVQKHQFFSAQLSFGESNGTPLQYSCLEKPMDGGAWKAAVHGVAESQTQLSDFTFMFHFMHWRRKWQPTPVFLPEEYQGLGSLVGCRLWGRTESDTTEVT